MKNLLWQIQGDGTPQSWEQMLKWSEPQAGRVGFQGELLLKALRGLFNHLVCLPHLRSAHQVARYRPRAPIIAVTRNHQTARQAHLYRGIFPVVCKDPVQEAWAEDVDLRVNLAMNVGTCQGERAPGGGLGKVLEHWLL